MLVFAATLFTTSINLRSIIKQSIVESEGVEAGTANFSGIIVKETDTKIAAKIKRLINEWQKTKV